MALGCNQLIHESFHNLSNLVFSSDVGDEAILKELLERYTSSVDEVCVTGMVNLIYLYFLEVDGSSTCLLYEFGLESLIYLPR